MPFLTVVATDVLCGVRDSLSGWWVALKCWQDEAKQMSNRPKPPKGFAELAKKKQEAKGIRVDETEA